MFESVSFLPPKKNYSGPKSPEILFMSRCKACLMPQRPRNVVSSNRWNCKSDWKTTIHKRTSVSPEPSSMYAWHEHCFPRFVTSPNCRWFFFPILGGILLRVKQLLHRYVRKPQGGPALKVLKSNWAGFCESNHRTCVMCIGNVL